MQYAANDIRKVGTITAISGKIITVDSVVSALADGKFIFATKPARIEGSDIRGYYLEAKVKSSDQDPVELNGVTVNAVLSKV